MSEKKQLGTDFVEEVEDILSMEFHCPTCKQLMKVSLKKLDVKEGK